MARPGLCGVIPASTGFRRRPSTVCLFHEVRADVRSTRRAGSGAPLSVSQVAIAFTVSPLSALATASVSHPIRSSSFTSTRPGPSGFETD